MQEWTFLESHSGACMPEDFPGMVWKKYHFNKEDFETLREVAQQVSECVKGQEGFFIRMPKDGRLENHALVIMTLGRKIDELQEHYSQLDCYLESYMAAVLCSELLLDCYRQFETWLLAKYGWYVREYRFFGSGDHQKMELEQIPAILQASGQKTVTCTGGCCLQPKNSVIFCTELTLYKNEQCLGICQDCSHKACPNRKVSDFSDTGR